MKAYKKRTIYFVDSIDTEGPLLELIKSKLERTDELCNINVPLSQLSLNKLTAGELDIGGLTLPLQKMLESHKSTTLGSWTEIVEMLERVTCRSFRFQQPDSDGNGWTYNWFCMDHTPTPINPRKRDIGDRHIHDFYCQLVKSQPEYRDSIHFHFHPISTYFLAVINGGQLESLCDKLGSSSPYTKISYSTASLEDHTAPEFLRGCISRNHDTLYFIVNNFELFENQSYTSLKS